MFEAMQAGTGTLSTTHSHSADSTIDRLASRVAQGGVLTVDEAYRQIAHNIALFIYVRLVDETWKGGARRRYVSEIRQVTRAIESGRPVTHLTYHATGTPGQPAGLLPRRRLRGRAAALPPRTARAPRAARRTDRDRRSPPSRPACWSWRGLLGIGHGLRRTVPPTRQPAPRAPRRALGAADPPPAGPRGPPPRPDPARQPGRPDSSWPRCPAGWSPIVVAPLLALGLPYLLVLPQAARRRAAGGPRPLGPRAGGDPDHRQVGHRRDPDLPADRAAADRRRGRHAGRPAEQPLGDRRRPAAVRRRPRLTRRRRGGRRLDPGRRTGAPTAPRSTLQALADSIQDQLKGAPGDRDRAGQAVRRGPPGHVITLITLVGVFVLSPGFFAAYRTPLGQVILSVLMRALPRLADLDATQGPAAAPRTADPGRSRPR